MSFDIFIQGFLARLLYQHELTITAIRQFQPERYPLAALAAGLGALLASAILYAIGIWLRRLPDKISTDEQKNRIALLRAVAVQWLPWLLILSPSPIGGILIISAGFFAIRPTIAALAITAAEVLWRVSPLL